MKPIVKIGAARIRAVDRKQVGSGAMPYFASTLISFPIIEAKDCPSMGMSGSGLLYFNPDFVDGCSVPELATVLIHEALHFIRNHAARKKAVGAHQDPKLADLWNIAADMEINDDLQAANCKFPEKYPPATAEAFGFPDGLLAEAYYRRLLDQKDEQGDGAGGGEGDGEGDGEGKLMAGACGSVAGRKGAWESDEAEAQMGRSESSQEAMRQQAAVAISNAAKDPMKGQGTVPNGLARWAQDRLGTSKVPWQKLLAMAVRRASVWARGKVNYSFKKRSRRQASLGYGRGAPILPGLRKPVPNIWGVIDTSGSMGENDLGDAMRETKAVLDASGGSLSFVVCDATVHGVTKIRDFGQAKKLLKGGGGTSFMPVFKAYENAQDKPHVIVMFTDGGGDAPAEAPVGVKVIWCLIGKHKQKPFKHGNWNNSVDWGTFIEIDSEEKK